MPKFATLTGDFTDAVWADDDPVRVSRTPLSATIEQDSSAPKVNTDLNTWDLVGSEVRWRMAKMHSQAVTGNQSIVEVRVAGSNQNMLRMLFTSAGTKVYCRYHVAGAATTLGTPANYDPAKPYFRFREAGGTVFWERSADNAVWEKVYPEAEWVHTINLSACGLFITSQGTAAAGNSLVVDKLNVFPAAGPVFSVWDGAVERASVSVGVWNGSAEVPGKGSELAP
jgi:hypothetical protein